MTGYLGIFVERLWTARTLSLHLCMLFLAGSAFGNPIKLFKEGNMALADQRYDDAINAYHAAAVEAPESAEIYFNLGQAQYRAGGMEDAIASFEYAASLARTDSMRSRSWYNLGNCLIRTGEHLRETDAQAAAYSCRQAAWFYRTALDYDPHFNDAAYNLEMSRWIAADIEKQVQEEKEKEQQENALIQYIRGKLMEFIARQTKLIEISMAGEQQLVLETETRALSKVMEASGLHADTPLPDGTVMAGPLKKTFDHTDAAADEMVVPDQPLALAELVAALEALPEDPDQQENESDENSEDYEDFDMEYEEADQEADMYEEADPFGDFSEYEEIRGVPPPNQSEMDILAEEVRNQDRRKEKKAGQYKAVEKDW